MDTVLCHQNDSAHVGLTLESGGGKQLVFTFSPQWKQMRKKAEVLSASPTGRTGIRAVWGVDGEQQKTLFGKGRLYFVW